METEPLHTDMGLKQGRILSPILFAICMADLKGFLKNSDNGILFNENYIHLLMFADDLVILSDNKSDF